MGRTRCWPRALAVGGLVVMLLGTLDPLEGSLLILLGIALLAISARLAESSYRRMLYAALALATVGVALLWALSAVGGFGGRSGRSMWWALLLLPYPAAWVIALVGSIRLLRENRSQVVGQGPV